MPNVETSGFHGEFARIAALRGEVIKAPYEMGGWIATVADPAET